MKRVVGDECYLILAGKKTTIDGSILGAHNDDLSGDQASLLTYMPRQSHTVDETVTFQTGLIIPEISETCAWTVQRLHKGFAEGDAVAMNEYGVSIVGGNAMTSDRNPKAIEVSPLVEKGLTGKVRYIALQRAKTARECLETLGKLYTTYGLRYLSGVGIADSNEIWYIEALGGHEWIAVKIPDDRYFLVANAYRIQQVNLKDTDNVMASPGLKELCINSGLWKPEDGPMNFAKMFGGGKQNENPYYDCRRVWEGQRILTPSLKQDPYAQYHPMFLKPDKKISIQRLAKVQRSQYEGTPFDAYSDVERSFQERPINMPRTIHFSTFQLRSWLPVEIGIILWSGMGSPMTTPLIPLYLGTSDIHSAYASSQAKYSPDCAWWLFNRNTLLANPYYNLFRERIVAMLVDFEEKEVDAQKSLEDSAMELYQQDKQKAIQELTYYSKCRCSEALIFAEKLFADLCTKISSKRGFPKMR